MRDIIRTVVCCWMIASLAPAAIAGPYAPAAGKAGSTAIAMDDPRFIAWASGWVDYVPGDNLASTWMDPHKAVGPAEGNSSDVVSLGSGGAITMTFDPPLSNGPGWDFAVFENSFSDTFLELAFVEVSSDGVHFIRFDTDSLTANPVGGFGAIDPTNIDGFAGKYRQGFGTPFDLADLSTKPEVLKGSVDLNAIAYVRMIDIVGDGTDTDTSGDVIWDPYPTAQSAGFDLDAVGGRYHPIANSPPAQPSLASPEDGSLDIALSPTLVSGAFADENTTEGDFHSQTRWQVSTSSNFETLQLDLISPTALTRLLVPATLLTEDTVYYWRVQYFDGYALGSAWSAAYSFHTTAAVQDGNANGIADDQELALADAADLNQDGVPDVSQIDDQFKVLKAIDGAGQIALETTSSDDIIEQVESCPASVYLNEGGQSHKPLDIRYGILGFRVRVQDPGAAASMVVYFSDPLPDAYQWVAYDLVKGWQVDAAAGFSADRRSLAFTVKDGGQGDADGLANGIIVNTVGPGSFAPETVVAPASGSAGIGGSSGLCFIAAAGDALDIDGLKDTGGRWVVSLWAALGAMGARLGQ